MEPEEKLTKLQSILKMLDETVTKKEFLESFKNVISLVHKALATLNDKIDRRLASLSDGKDGKDGSDGKDGVNGRDGRDGVNGVDGKDGIAGANGSPDFAEDIRNKLELLDGDERLDKKAIRGLDLIETDVFKLKTRPVNLGGAKGITLYVDGKKKLLTAQTVNLVPGSGVTMTYAYANGRNDITISASGGSFAILAATGTIDNSNTAFTFLSKPGIVVVNGASYQENKGWTWNAGTLTVTLDSPVGGGGDIYGIG